MDKLLILMGLPGSGKSTFAKNYQDSLGNKIKSLREMHRDVTWIDIDNIMERDFPDTPKEEAIKEILHAYLNVYADVSMLDGLFLSEKDIDNILSIVSNIKIKEIEIHYWNPDRDKCLWNDRYRRAKSSEVTIKNAITEIPNIESLKTKYSTMTFTLKTHDVVKKSEFQMFLDKYKIHVENTGNMYSASWSLGGTYGSCWGEGGVIAPEATPACFVEFDELLEKICPDINFMKYKRLYRECVSTDSKDSYDYYGGHTREAFFVCDVGKLYDMLKDMGFSII